MDPILALLLMGVDITPLLISANQYRNRQSSSQRYPFAPPGLTPQGEGSRGEVEGEKGTMESGPLSAAERASISGFGSLTGPARSMIGGQTPSLSQVANMAMGLIGSSLPGFGTALSGMKLGTLGLSSLAEMLGAPREVNFGLGFGPNDLQSIADTYGGFAAADARAQALDARQSMFDALAAGHRAGWGSTPTGWGGALSAPSASIGNPDMDSGGMSGLGVSGGMSSSSGGLAGVGEAPGDSGRNDGTGPGIAKGGAFFAKRPTTVTFGEPSTKGETAIFIPEWMRKPGIQSPEESQVRNALLRAILALR